MITPSGVTIAQYRWDFGNGQIGYGAKSTTTYTYNLGAINTKATLTVIDSLGRTASCSHSLNLLKLTSVFFTANRWVGTSSPASVYDFAGLGSFYLGDNEL